ncbi:MAG: hypothetical protein ACRELA_07845 [Candidatus Rokuibacteriota bacterium]
MRRLGIRLRGGSLWSRRSLAAALLVSGLTMARGAAAILPELSAADIKRAIDEGSRAIAQEEADEEWRIRLPGGEDVVVTTPFSRLWHAARRAAFKGEPLTDKQLQEQLDRGKGKLQLVVTMYGRQVDFARWYQPVLRAGPGEIKATFTQNERTALPVTDGRFAARNVYVFPIEGLPVQGTATLVVQHSIDRKEILRATLDLSRMR